MELLQVGEMMRILGVIGLIFLGLFAVLVVIFEKDKEKEKALLKQINVQIFVLGAATLLLSFISKYYWTISCSAEEPLYGEERLIVMRLKLNGLAATATIILVCLLYLIFNR